MSIWFKKEINIHYITSNRNIFT